VSDCPNMSTQIFNPYEKRRKGRTPRWRLTSEITERIRKVFRTSTGNGEVRDLACHLGIPRWRISRWAVALGVVETRSKEPDWSEKEIAILERWGHLTIERIQGKLRREGFGRSLVAIVLKRKRLRIPANFEEYTANGLAECFGVDIKTITRWIDKGLLKAGRRGTDRLEQQGGDMWWIKPGDVRRFVVVHTVVIDFRKVDKFWLVDLLACTTVHHRAPQTSS